MLLLSSGDFFQNELFRKVLSGALSECQTVWIQIRTDILSILIWVQILCKGYQQTKEVTASKERIDETTEEKITMDYFRTVLASSDFCHLLITLANS